MIRPYFELFRVSFQVVPIFFQCSYNGEQLLVINLIITFMDVERLGVEGDWMPQLVCGVPLGQD